MAWIARELGAEILPVPVDESWQITGNLTGQDFPVCRFLPHKTCGEGLFLAVLRKEGSVEDDEVPFRTEGGKPERTKKGKQKGGKGAAPLAVPEEMKGWLQALADEAWDFRVEDDRCLAIPQQWSGLYDYLRSRLRILHAGVTLGELKGRDWQPHHSLAMSTRLNRGVFPEASLDYMQAVAYLRKEAVTLEPDVRAAMCCSPIRAILWALRRISATVPTISIRPNGGSGADIFPKNSGLSDGSKAGGLR